jgi:hypothetical protein
LGIIRERRSNSDYHSVHLISQAMHRPAGILAADPAGIAGHRGDFSIESGGQLQCYERAPLCNVLYKSLVKSAALRL